jgi:hypothetical protein
MRATSGLVYRAAFALAVLCTGGLVFNIVALPIFKDQVFLERGQISTGGELAILIGFVLVLVFTIVSLIWVSSRIRKAQIVRKGDIGLVALGALCLILMAGEKAMVDEIGREYMLGWEVVGEWIILYAFLAIQLIYNVIVLRRLYRARIRRV